MGKFIDFFEKVCYNKKIALFRGLNLFFKKGGVKMILAKDACSVSFEGGELHIDGELVENVFVENPTVARSAWSFDKETGGGVIMRGDIIPVERGYVYRAFGSDKPDCGIVAAIIKGEVVIADEKNMARILY